LSQLRLKQIIADFSDGANKFLGSRLKTVRSIGIFDVIKKNLFVKLQTVRLLILCKTYPSPSAKYTETSCVAAMTEEGKLIRIYPVPFRLVGDEQQFKKWQWVTAKIEKANNDNRPESHRIDVSSIQCEGDPLSTKKYWGERRHWLNKLFLFHKVDELELARQRDGITLALLKPSAINSLRITPVKNPEWTEEEKAKLLREQIQGSLFEMEEKRVLQQLQKLLIWHQAVPSTFTKSWIGKQGLCIGRLRKAKIGKINSGSVMNVNLRQKTSCF